MKSSITLLVYLLVVTGCGNGRAEGEYALVGSDSAVVDLQASVGPCILADAGAQPRAGFAIHSLQPRVTNHPDGLGGMGFTTTCVVEDAGLRMDATISLPFLIDQVVEGTYEVLPFDETMSFDGKSAFASLGLEIGGRPEVAFGGSRGVVRIANVSTDSISGSYRFWAVGAEAVDSILVEGAFSSRPDRDDLYTRYAIGEIDGRVLLDGLFEARMLSEAEYRAALDSLSAG